MNGELHEPLVLVGLGNPGSQYADTRHNLGWKVVEALGRKHGWPFKEEKKFNAYVAKGTIGESTVYLLLPTTYMNNSGVALASLLSFYKLSANTVVVVVDDTALALGQMRLRTTGSAGGHNGLKSIQQHLGSQHYTRLRLGIGRQPFQRDLADYVLDRFNSEELEELNKCVQRAVETLELLTKQDLEQVMNQVNPALKSKGETEEKQNETQKKSL